MNWLWNRKAKHHQDKKGPGSSNIAVIGMACRFPGAKNYHEFLNNLITR